MATFNISWSNVGIPTNTNVISQRIEYRRKTVGGAFISTGFTPANNLPTSATAASITSLADNVVFEFRVAAICTIGGPTYNTNGIRESIKFICPTVVASTSDTAVTVTASGLPVDITKVIFNIGTGPISVLTSGGSAAHTFTGLVNSTLYNVTSEIAAIVNGVELVSTLGTCSTPATTTAPANCTAPQNLIVSSANS